MDLVEETEETEKNETEEEALVSTKDDSEATKASVQVTKEARATKKSEDHDSSATCSADEETHTLENIQVKDQVITSLGKVSCAAKRNHLWFGFS